MIQYRPDDILEIPGVGLNNSLQFLRRDDGDIIIHIFDPGYPDVKRSMMAYLSSDDLMGLLRHWGHICAWHIG